MTGTVLALDLGGTHVSAGRVDVERRAVDASRRVELAAAAGRDELLEHITRAAAGVQGDAELVGFAAPGPFDYPRGVPWLDHKLEALYGVDLRAPLASTLGLPEEAIAFVNDADAFLLGEWWTGAAAGHARVVGITLGTGVGSAFLADGAIVDSGPMVPPAGEIHRITHHNAPLEHSVSRAALIAGYGDPAVDVEEIATRARAGDDRARTAFDGVSRVLGDALAPWLVSFGATCLVVGGSIAAAWDLIERGLRAVLGGQVEIVRAQQLEDAALLGAAYTAALRASVRGRPVRELTVAEARAAQAAEIPSRLGDDGLETVDLDGPVPIRLYRPRSAEPLPACVWLPGGGWVLDTTAVSDPLCRRLAADTPCAVAMARYPLAPEHRFPAQVESSLATVRWLVANAGELGLDPTRVAVGGASAGANLAAAVSLLGRDAGGPTLAAQILAYPPLLHEPNVASGVEPDGSFTRRDVDLCWSHYLERPDDGRNALASPLLAESHDGLPPTLVVVAELDPLRDEGGRYAALLERSGVRVQLASFDGARHGFLSGEGAAAEDARRLVVEMLQDAFSLASST